MIAVLSRAIGGLRAVNTSLELLLKPCCIVLMFAMLGTVVWTVTARLTGISAPWTEKVMLILLPSLAFLVAPIAYRRSANVALDLLHDALPKRLQGLHALVIHLMILSLLLISLDLTLRKVGLKWDAFTWVLDGIFGLDLNSIRPFKAKIKIPVLGIQWRTVYMLMPVCVAMMIIVNLELLLRELVALLYPRDETVKPVRSFEETAPGVGE